MCVLGWVDEPSTSSLAAAAGGGLSQLLAIWTGVNHLVCVLAHPDRHPVGVGLLGLKRAMHLGTVAAALVRGRHAGGGTKGKNGDVRGGWMTATGRGGRCFNSKHEGVKKKMRMMMMISRGAIKTHQLTKLGIS